MDPVETHEKIISVLREKGPSLPINLAKALSISSLFISAFLSELTNQKRIKVSNLKVGGSPLYFLDGQEEKLEDYYKYLHPREAEAFLLLREHKVLRDDDQEPATRVALRAIKDFSVGFKMNDQIYWRFVSVPSNDVDEILNGGKNEVVEEKVEEVEEDSSSNSDPQPPHPSLEKQSQTHEVSKDVDEPVEQNQAQDEKPKEIVAEKSENKFNNPLVINQVKKKKEKAKSEFVVKVIEFIRSKNLEIVEEKEFKVKEYNCVVRVRSELGPISFLTQAKDKKTITEGDFKKLLSDAQSIPLPALMLYTGEVSKKAKEYLVKYSSVLKAKRIG